MTFALKHVAALAILAFGIRFTAAQDLSNLGQWIGGQWVAGGKGDPVFHGLDGRTFYFDGIIDKTFNILSEQDHQLNADFSLGPHLIDSLGKKTNGTFMTAFGLQVHSSKVEVHVNEEGEMTVTVNGKATEELLQQSNDYFTNFTEPQGVTITIEKYRPALGHAVIVQSPLMEIALYATPKQFDPEVNQIARGHLNFQMGVNPELLCLTEVHGVLGQSNNQRSSDTALIPDQLSTMFLGEGETEDYIVSDLFSTDCKFNKFGSGKIVKAGSLDQTASLKKMTSLKLSSSRRHLREGAKITYHPFAKLTGML